jgi:hypothetical protein
MAEISKQALKVDNNQSFPNNNNGAITPSILRAFNTNMIDSMVNQISYNVDSASWNQQIDSLEVFTGSTAISITNLNASSASQQISINALNVFTASAAGLTTGSLLVTASFNNGTRNLTFTKGDASTFNVNIPDVSGSTLPSGTISGSAQITALGFVSSSVTASSLVTASVSLNTITFTKGDASTFNITVNTGSAAAINTGSFATTGSNTFIGNQTISGSLFQSGSLIQVGTSEISGTINITGSTTIKGTTRFENSSTTITGSLLITGSTTQIGNNLLVGNTTLSGSVFVSGNIEITNGANLITHNVKAAGSNGLDLLANNGATIATMGQGGGTQAQFLGSLSANSLSASTINGLGNPLTFSSSVDSRLDTLETATASLFTSASLALTTASVSGQTMTFRKGDGTTFDVTLPAGSGSVINTGSFATTGSNSFNGDQNVTGSVRVSNQLIIGNLAQSPTIQDLDSGTPAGDTSLQINAGTSGSFSLRTLYGAGVGVANMEAYDTFPSFNTGGKISAKSAGGVDIIGYSGAISVTGSSLTMQGFTYPTTDGTNGQVLTTNGSKVLSFTTVSGSGGSIDTGSFATTGSNVFTGDQTFIDNGGNFFTITDASGSMMLVGKSYTSSSAHISSSVPSLSGSYTNLIFKTNNNTAETIISGSNNIFQNPAAPTAGFKRYLSANNIALGAGFPQISSSMAFSPAVSNNYFGAQALTMRGPVSASAWTITGNNFLGSINLGLGTGTNSAEKLTSTLTMTGNYVAGTFNLTVGTTALTASTVTVSNNNINGTAGLTLNQSAVNFTGNTINDGGFGLTNNYFSQSAGLGLVTLQRNTIAGNNNGIIVTGSLQSGVTAQPQFNDNLIGGSTNTISSNSSTSRVSGSATFANLHRSIIYGNFLNVTASMAAADVGSQGSAFFGRYNVDDSIRNKSSDIVFAVGTGNATTRKTGFLIDSGSNTFIEGTLNVSGSTTMTGSLILSSSNAVELQVIGNSVFTGSAFGNVVSMSIAANTASMDLNLGNYFTLTLADTTTTHISASNVQPGVSATLVITTGTNSSASLAPTMLQPSGSAYSATAGSAKKDVLSIVAVASGVPFVVSTKNMI